MAFDYRSELKRPASLVLAAVAVLGWLLALAIGLSSSDQMQEARAETTRLQQAQVDLQRQLDEQQRTGRTLANLEDRVSAAQQQLTQVTRAREQVQAQLATLQQTIQASQQQLTQAAQSSEQL